MWNAMVILYFSHEINDFDIEMWMWNLLVKLTAYNLTDMHESLYVLLQWGQRNLSPFLTTLSFVQNIKCTQWEQFCENYKIILSDFLWSEELTHATFVFLRYLWLIFRLRFEFNRYILSLSFWRHIIARPWLLWFPMFPILWLLYFLFLRWHPFLCGAGAFTCVFRVFDHFFPYNFLCNIVSGCNFGHGFSYFICLLCLSFLQTVHPRCKEIASHVGYWDSLLSTSSLYPCPTCWLSLSSLLSSSAIFCSCSCSQLLKTVDGSR